MSDYLTRLVERELGLTPLVKPRVAPRFATGPEILASLEPGPFQELLDDGWSPSETLPTRS
jgi:hypothetical protein